MNWNDTSVTPPNNIEIEVLYDNGNTGIGFATYYPFKMDKNKKTYSFNEYWDGGYIINETKIFAEGKLNQNNGSEIIGWRATHRTDLSQLKEGGCDD